MPPGRLDDSLLQLSLGASFRGSFSQLECWPLSLCLTEVLVPPVASEGPSPIPRRRSGCINTVRWNERGTLLVGAGDCLRLSIWSGVDCKPLAELDTLHFNNIFDAAFVPGGSDSQLVSCAGDGQVILHDLSRPLGSTPFGTRLTTTQTTLRSQSRLAVDIEFLPTDSNCLLTTFKNENVVRIDLRTPELGEILFSQPSGGCGCIAFDPIHPHEFAVASSDAFVRTFDLRQSVLGDPFTFSRCLREFCHPGAWIAT